METFTTADEVAFLRRVYYSNARNARRLAIIILNDQRAYGPEVNVMAVKRLCARIMDPLVSTP